MAGTNMLLDDQDAILGAAEELGCVLENGFPFFDAPDTIVQSIDTKKMTADFVIVTRGSNPNRHGALVQIAEGGGYGGLQTQNFNRNPVVMFGHGMEGMAFGGVIGSAMNPDTGEVVLKKSATKAVSRVHFSQSLPDAGVVFAAVSEGMFRAASVQFMPSVARRFALPQLVKKGDDQDTVNLGSSTGLDFLESDLYEWSIVPIGADPDALRKSLDRNAIGGERLTASIKRILTAACEPKKLAVQGFDIKELVRQRVEPLVVRQAALNRKYANVLGLTDVPAI